MSNGNLQNNKMTIIMKILSALFKFYFSNDNMKKETLLKTQKDLGEDKLKNEKTIAENIEKRKQIEFNSKMNEYLTNPYNYSLSKFSLESGISEDEILSFISNNENLSMRFNHIIFSQKTSKEELYNQLLNSIPPEFETTEKYNLAIENPAFRVVFFYYWYETTTVDYFKLESEMKLSNQEIQKVFQVYINKSDELSKSINLKKEIDERRHENHKADNLLAKHHIK